MKSRGFTLLELLITLTVAAVLGAMLLTFLGTNVMQSGNPVVTVGDYNDLNQVMERIVEEYKARIKNGNLKIGGTAGLLSWVQANYGSYVDGANTKFITFDGTNREVSCTYGQPDCLTLKLALKKNNQRVINFFTE